MTRRRRVSCGGFVFFTKKERYIFDISAVFATIVQFLPEGFQFYAGYVKMMWTGWLSPTQHRIR